MAGDEAVGSGHAHSADERCLEGAEQSEKKKCDGDGKQRQQCAKFLSLQITGDDGEEFHGMESATSRTQLVSKVRQASAPAGSESQGTGRRDARRYGFRH